MVMRLLENMSAPEVIDQIKALPTEEHVIVFDFLQQALAPDDSWISESFKRGMADAEAGCFADMETVLSGTKPPARSVQ